MKNIRRRASRLKRAVAWLLTAAIVSGNVSQLGAMTSYGAERSLHTTATPSSADLASPSEATPAEARKVINVTVTQSAILKVLKKDSDRRPEFNEDQVPFEGEQKDLVIEKIYEELEGKTLILQRKVGKAMYLVVVSDTLGGDPFSDFDPSDRISQEAALKNVQVIGVNGYKDRECQFRLRITGEDITITEASISEFAVVGENETDPDGVKPVSPEPVNASGGAGSNASQTVTGKTGQEQSGETAGAGTQNTGKQNTGKQNTGTQNTETQNSETQGTDTRNTEAQNTETQNIETQNTDTQGTDTQGANTQSTDTQDTQTQNAETKNNGAKDNGTKNSETNKSNVSNSHKTDSENPKSEAKRIFR